MALIRITSYNVCYTKLLRAMFVDDLERNTLAAESVGIPSIVFTGVAALREELAARGIL